MESADEVDMQDMKLLRNKVTEEEIAEVVSKWTGIPVVKMLEGEKDKLLRMEEDLSKRVVGQDEADIKQGLISINSPVAKGLIGHLVDDEVHVKVPSGIRVYEIIEINYI